MRRQRSIVRRAGTPPAPPTDSALCVATQGCGTPMHSCAISPDATCRLRNDARLAASDRNCAGIGAKRREGRAIVRAERRQRRGIIGKLGERCGIAGIAGTLPALARVDLERREIVRIFAELRRILAPSAANAAGWLADSAANAFALPASAANAPCVVGELARRRRYSAPSRSARTLSRQIGLRCR